MGRIFYHTVLTLVSVSLSLHSTSAQQLGPFTIPTLANGGALGFSNNFFSALVDPRSRRLSFSAQAPPIGVDGGSASPLSSFIGRFNNPLAGFLPGQTNVVPIQTPSLSALTPSNVPGVSEFTNILRNFGNGIPSGVNRIQGAANTFQNLATDATRRFLTPSSVRSSSTSSSIPSAQQLPGVSEFTNALRSFGNAIPDGINRIQSASNTIQSIASNATEAFLNRSGARSSSVIPSNRLLPGVPQFTNILRSFGNASNTLQGIASNATERFLNPFGVRSSSSSSVHLPGVSEFTNILQSFGNGIPAGIGGIRNAANAFQRLASNASQTGFNPAAVLRHFGSFVPNTGQRALPLPNVNFTSNAEVSVTAGDSEGNEVDTSSRLAIAPRVDVPVNRNDPHYYPGRQVMVHLFEWTFDAIAEECEQILGPAGYGGVQVSPINEYVIAPNRPWWERYQPISYIINSRSGSERQFATMVRRCQLAGVRVYVDVVVNHMAAPGANVPLIGTAGSPSNPGDREYPAVPYNQSHFHPDCTIRNYQNATEVRDCALNGLSDLNQTEPYVQDRIVEFMNRLIELGVAGFRMDASKHMWPEDLNAIYKRLNFLNKDFEFSKEARPFIYQEVIDLGSEPVTASQYTDLGHVTEFKYSLFVGLIFRGALKVSALEALARANATQVGLTPSDAALVFVDNHDNQRGHGAGGDSILTFKDGQTYTQAIAFTLATDYGTVRLMSSYNFTDTDQGPPSDDRANILPPGINADGSCQNGWVCEHRWLVVRRMVSFRNFVAPAPLTDVQYSGGTFAFCRGTVGFALFNAGQETSDGIWKACLPPGEYCDIISGARDGTMCTGTRVLVDGDGRVSLTVPRSSSIVLDLLNRVS
ncbi:alpha-amylase I-like [Anopheles merus]|uniref:alpha-amylase I-like n=1 Tax=Anopheles merus TaxID=30066 RepID=UPI001BE436B3|nr:alpha-amylase I-like [Anopheles merus]